MRLRIRAAVLLAMASCGGTRSDAAAPPPDPRFDLAIAVPRTTHLVWVPHASLRPWGRRDLASTIRSCRGDGPAPWNVARDEATCGALRLDGDRVIVPFVAPRSPVELMIDRAFVIVGPASGAAHDRPRIAVAIDSVHYDASLRVQVGGRAFDCLGRADDRDQAQAIVDLCSELRAP